MLPLHFAHTREEADIVIPRFEQRLDVQLENALFPQLTKVVPPVRPKAVEPTGRAL
jgi:hypothetical protein